MSWLRNWLATRLAVSFTKPNRPPTFRPGVEVLESRQLLTAISLSTPIATSPSGSVISAEPAFTWNGVTGADHYDVWVDDQTTGQTAVLRNQAVPGTSWVA